MIAEIKKRDTIIEELTHIVEEGEKTTVEMIMENDMLKRRLMIYENAHAPPSHGSVPAQQKKTHSAKGTKSSEQAEDKPVGTPGRKPGHTGVSHRRRSKESVHHRPDKCEGCGSTNISDVHTTTKQIVDIPEMPEAEIVTHVCHQCICQKLKMCPISKFFAHNFTS